MQYTAIQYQNEGGLYAPSVNYTYHAPTVVLEKTKSKTLARFAKITALLGILILLISYVPVLIGNMQQSVSTRIVQTAQGADSSGPEQTLGYQPVFDANLPKANRLSIPSIGVDTKIEEASYDSYEDALGKGVWRVTNFGTPTSTGKPTILAAHRFGYLKWSREYRRKNSFYNLPSLEVGDTVEIIWRQRKYVYKIYAEAESDKIEDYSADLILYTCKYLTGSTRVFKYAKLLTI